MGEEAKEVMNYDAAMASALDSLEIMTQPNFTPARMLKSGLGDIFSTNWTPPSLRNEANATESPVINTLMVEVADGACGTQYVYKPWTLTDIKEVSAELPKVEEVGGREYSRLLELLIHQYIPTIAEIRRLLMADMGLK